MIKANCHIRKFKCQDGRIVNFPMTDDQYALFMAQDRFLATFDSLYVQPSSVLPQEDSDYSMQQNQQTPTPERKE